MSVMKKIDKISILDLKECFIVEVIYTFRYNLDLHNLGKRLLDGITGLIKYKNYKL